MTEQRHGDRRADPIFVGYLPTPSKDHAFLRLWLPILLIITVIVAVGLSIKQPLPGQGVWDLGKELALEGELVPGPYPVLRVLDESGSGEVHTWLLVEQGKIGVQARVKTLGITEPTAVTARGFRIERDGQSMLELVSGSDALVISNSKTLDIPPTTNGPRTRVSLQGEIVDSKCWLGVMKPGFGKTHKACATLCIGGGIPPVFVWIDDTGRRQRALLLDQDGESLVERIIDVIADPIRVTGELEYRGDLGVLLVDASDGAIER